MHIANKNSPVSLVQVDWLSHVKCGKEFYIALARPAYLAKCRYYCTI